MRKWGLSAAFMLAPLVAILVVVQAPGLPREPEQPVPLIAPHLGAEVLPSPPVTVTPKPSVQQVAAQVAHTEPEKEPIVARARSGSAARSTRAAAESGIAAQVVSAKATAVASPTQTRKAALGQRPATLPPAAAPLAVPDRIYAPTIRLDSTIVPVGWREVKDRNGNVRSEWIVASYQAGWHKNSAMPGQGGNVVLAAHNNMEGEIFRYIENLKPGDPIFLYAGGRTFKYRVAEKFAVLEKGVSDAQRRENAKWIGPFSEERLTLISCWPYSGDTHRMFVIARPWG